MATPFDTTGSYVRQWLFRPVDIAALVYFRILFGFLLFVLVGGRLLYVVQRDWIREFYLDPPLLFRYYGFDWVHPWPGVGTYLHFAVMAIAALGIMLGCAYRLSASVFFVTWTHYFLLERAFYLNHFYLVCLFAFLLIFMDPHKSVSVDSWRRHFARPHQVEAWQLYAIRLQMGTVYFYAGIAKLRPDWLRGDVVRTGIGHFEAVPLVGPLIANEAGVFAITYGGLLFDLLAFPALLHPKTRPWAILAAGAFHGFNVIAFSINIFPWLAFGTTLMFLPPSWPRHALRRVRAWVGRPADRVPAKRMRDDGQSILRGSIVTRQRVTAVLLGVYFLVQILLPLRQFLYDGDPKWHEYGQRWAWRMMAGGKTGHTTFTVIDNATGDAWPVDPADYLHPRQVRKLAGDPDSMIQFSRFLAEEFRTRGHNDVQVHATALVSFNGRPEQPLIDPTIDLASQPRTLRLPDWVLPLEE